MKLNHKIRRCWSVFPLAVLLCFFAGCRLLDDSTSAPENRVAKFFPQGKPAQPEPGELQHRLLQYAESYSLQVIESIDEIQKSEGSPFSAEGALRFKITSVSSLITVASGENPNVNLLNLIVLTSMSRMVLENHWTTTPTGALFEPWLKRTQALEKNIWHIADDVLAKDQQDELRRSIEQHFGTLTDQNRLFLTHPQDLLIPKEMKKDDNERSVFSMATINPFSGLDPTVREIAQMRFFAERALFSIQWMPWLLRWQSQLLVLETTNQPEMAQTLENITSLSESLDRVSKAAESISQTAAMLPDKLTGEREAILSAMEQQEGKLTTMFEAGNELSVSLNTTIESLDQLMKRFGVGEPHPPRDPNRKRFDILDYAKTADSFTAMAEQLNATINELNTTLDSPALDELSDQTTTDIRGILNHAFLLTAGLAILVTACALLYRRIAGRKA